MDTLIREIEDFEEPEDYEVVTVFFGGGTPSILPGEAILRLMEALRKKFHFREEAEITLEANPGTVDEKKLSFYKKAGINRLSFGLQSTDAEELKKLGLDPHLGKFLESFELAAESRFFQYQRGSHVCPSGADGGKLGENAQTGHRLEPGACLRLQPDH